MRIFILLLMLNFSQSIQAHTFKSEKWQTNNGVEVLFYPAMEIPMLDISLAFAAGSAYDGNQYGLSTLTSAMLPQGSKGDDATALAAAFADTGAQFQIENSPDRVIFNLRTLISKQALTQSIRTFAQMISHPDFPNKAFTREKKQLLMAIEQSKQSPEDIADHHFLKALYQQHPYAHPVNGTNQTIAAIKKQDLIKFYRHYYVAHNATLVMVGAINSHTAHQLAKQLTQALPQGQSAKTIPQAKTLTKAKTINIPFPSSQTNIKLGHLGVEPSNPHHLALMVANYILGGNPLLSRLASEVREKRGLTYSIDSQLTPMLGKGPFIISLSTRNQQAQQAVELVQNILRDYINAGPSQQELAAAKQYITGSFPLSLASNRSIASLLLKMQSYHLPDDYLDTYLPRINALSTKEVQQAFQQAINPDKLLLVRVGGS